MTHSVHLRAADNSRMGRIDKYTSLECVLRHNDISTWVMEMPLDAPMADEIHYRNGVRGIIVERDGETLLSGPITRRNPKRDGAKKTLTVSGVDDTVRLDWREAWPTLPWGSNAYDSRSGAAETVLHGYVNANAGPGAATDRRVAGLTMGADSARGSSLSIKARFPTLLELGQEISDKGGGISFRIAQVGSALEFQTYMPVDLTTTAKFSVKLRNLLGYEEVEELPEGNYFVVGGSGDLTARTFRQGGDDPSIAQFGRIERFRDRRDTAVTAELDATIVEELAENAYKRVIGLTPIDTQSLSYGTDYGLGDTVRVTTEAGENFDEVIREVNLTWSAGEPERVRPVVGTPGTSDPATAPVTNDKEARRIIVKRLSNLERNK